MIVHVRKFVLPLCKLDNIGKIRKHIIRCNSSVSPPKVLECLSSRSLLRLTGNETPDFLQGLITNDMKNLEEGAANIYTLFLNFKGRVMYDSIIYKTSEEGIYYVECDSEVASSLVRHLKMYRLKRKIDIDDMNSEMKVWALFDPKQYSDTKNGSSETNNHKLEGSIFPCGTLNNQASKITENVLIYKDPRLQDLGFRILTKSGVDKEDIANCVDFDMNKLDSNNNYKTFLYRLGIGEGADDLEQGKSFPMEINVDYLHGISFHKGCYVGQELTARTYHTGVIRKRLMPLVFTEESDKVLECNEEIVNESGKTVGKFKGREGVYGLGLMRIAESLKSQSLSLCGMSVKVIKPNWWPQESETVTAHANSRKMESVATTSADKIDTEGKKDTTPKLFTCTYCALQERYDYKGMKAPFARQIVYSEDCYVMKDPFSLPNKGEVLVLGGDCNICNKSVCLNCSIYFGKRFCSKCAMDNIDCIPSQLHSKIKALINSGDS